MTQPVPAPGASPFQTQILTSFIRTAAPMIAGWLLTFIAFIGLDIQDDTVVKGVGIALTFLYYAVFRLLEEYVDPRFGWFLGRATAPRYSAVAGTTVVDQPPPGRDDRGEISLMAIALMTAIVVGIGGAILVWRAIL